MKTLIPVPNDDVRSKLAGSFWAIVFFKLTIGLTTYRFTSSPKQETWNGQTWDKGIPIDAIETTGEPGTLVLVLADLGLDWHGRLDAEGERDNDVEVWNLIPYGNPMKWFVKGGFVGKTLRQSLRRPTPDEGNGYQTVVEVADEAAFPRYNYRQWASDSFQIGLSKAAGRAEGAYDNSHEIANKARQLIWHRQ